MRKNPRSGKRQTTAPAQPAPHDTLDDDDDAIEGAADRQETEEARRKREKWERAHARWLRERDEMRRALFTAFKMWTICPRPECKRAKACRGRDTEECRKLRWREAVPDELRAELSKIASFMREGYTLEEAGRLAHEDMRMREEIMEKYAARLHAAPPASALAPKES